MPATTQTSTDLRRTDWVQVENLPAWAGSGISAYRIWQEFTGRDWFQRHEWKRTDGTTDMQDWIPGARSWCPSAQPVAA